MQERADGTTQLTPELRFELQQCLMQIDVRQRSVDAMIRLTHTEYAAAGKRIKEATAHGLPTNPRDLAVFRNYGAQLKTIYNTAAVLDNAKLTATSRRPAPVHCRPVQCAPARGQGDEHYGD